MDAVNGSSLYFGSDHCLYKCVSPPEFVWISLFSVLLMKEWVVHKVYMVHTVKCDPSSNKCPERIVVHIRKKRGVFRDGCFNMGSWPAISFGPWIDGSANSPFLFSVEGRHLGISFRPLRGKGKLLTCTWRMKETLFLEYQKFYFSVSQVFCF